MTDTLTQADLALAQLARNGDTNAFIEFVGIDSETGDRVLQAECHQRWQQLRREHERFILYAPIFHAKTMQACYTIAHEIALDTLLTYGIGCSEYREQAVPRVNTVREIVESPRYQALFPHVQRGNPWGDSGFQVRDATREIPPSPNPTCKPFSTFGAVLGSGFTGGVVLDDLMDLENTYSKHMRDRVYKWLKSTLFGRLRGGKGAKPPWLWIIGTAWHSDDAIHRLEDELGIPVETLLEHGNPGRRYIAVLREETTVEAPLWPEHNDAAWVRGKEQELGSIETARQLRNDAKSDTLSYFPWDTTIAVALQRGIDEGACLDVCHWRDDPQTPKFRAGHPKAGQPIPQNEVYIMGVDFGIVADTAHDPTRIVVDAVHVSGERRLAYMLGGHWSGPDTMRRIIETWRMFRCEIWPESVQAQQWMVQFLDDAARNDPTLMDMLGNIHGYKTSYKKADPIVGIPAIATHMEQGRIVLPCDKKSDGTLKLDPRVKELIDECRAWTPHDHAGDWLMAWLCASEGGRQWLAKHVRKPKGKQHVRHVQQTEGV